MLICTWSSNRVIQKGGTHSDDGRGIVKDKRRSLCTGKVLLADMGCFATMNTSATNVDDVAVVRWD